MKNTYKYIGILVIMVFSFYYTEKIALMVQNNNPIMKQINEIKQDSQVSSVNAIIDGDKIIPGKNGLTVNSSKSYGVMKSFGTFNSYYLVYDQVKPKVSLENNKDKIIYKGNNSNKNVSFILQYDEKIINYLKSLNIKFDLLITKQEYKVLDGIEYINNDFDNYMQMDAILNKRKINNNLCYVENEYHKKECIKKNKYLINTDLVLTNNNLVEIKNKITNGSIILISKNTNLDNIKLLINQVKFKGLNMVYLSNLISEEN